MVYTYIDTLVGRLMAAVEGGYLRILSFSTGKKIRHPQPAWEFEKSPRNPILKETARQLVAYFDTKLQEFDLPLAPSGTDFELDIYRALRNIPFGQTISYGALARKIGRPKASRAVGMANGKNPIPIIIPCHRVIGASGKLTGFGGGLAVKRILLDLERSARPFLVTKARFGT